MKLRIILVLATLAAGLSIGSPVSAQTTALVGARVIDGKGGTIDNAAIIVRDGKIAQVGPAASTPVPQGAERVDVKGMTIIPGLINAHGHITDVVGLRADKAAGNTRENVLRQLKTYAQYGVTTVFSLGDEPEPTFQLRSEQTSGPLDRSRVFLSGPVINADSAEAARAMTDKVAALHPDVLKIRVDDTLGSARKMPEAAWRATIDRAKELKMPIATHIFYLSDAKAVLDAGSNIIAHSVRDVPVDEPFLSMMKARNACYIPTLMREVSTFVYGSTPTWASDPFFTRGLGNMAADIGKQLSDPQRQSEIQASAAYKQGLRYKEQLAVAKKNLKTVSDRGILVAMGTDTGPPSRFQGFFEHLELEMMVESGLTPMQTLVAATGNAARCHGKEGQIGAIAPGAAADFVVLKDNPLTDIKATRTIQSVWIAGKRLP